MIRARSIAKSLFMFLTSKYFDPFGQIAQMALAAFRTVERIRQSAYHANRLNKRILLPEKCIFFLIFQTVTTLYSINIRFARFIINCLKLCSFLLFRPCKCIGKGGALVKMTTMEGRVSFGCAQKGRRRTKGGHLCAKWERRKVSVQSVQCPCITGASLHILVSCSSSSSLSEPCSS